MDALFLKLGNGDRQRRLYGHFLMLCLRRIQIISKLLRCSYFRINFITLFFVIVVVVGAAWGEGGSVISLRSKNPIYSE